MEPIKNQLLQNIISAYNNDPNKYASYRSSNKPLDIIELREDLDRFFAIHIEIRRQQRRAADLNKWWGLLNQGMFQYYLFIPSYFYHIGGNYFIQQCFSRNQFKLIKYTMLATSTTTGVEEMLKMIKQKTHNAIKLPLFIIVDECMVKARIHHLVSFFYMTYYCKLI